MKNRLALAFLFAVLTPLCVTGSPEGASGGEAERFWPQWRGPLMTGVAPHATPPLEWSETKNVRWKVAIPGKGSSTPVVWGDRIFVLTAVPTGEPKAVPATAALPPRPAPAPPAASSAAAPPPGGPRPGGGPPRSILPEYTQQFTVLALRRSDGQLLWKRVVREEQPHEGTHPTGTWASASAATDGKVVLAFFGSRGLYALDMEGKPLWEKDLGDMKVKLGFGEGSTPALAKDQVFVQWDHDGGDSFLVALDRQTGKELWRQKRDEETSWASRSSSSTRARPRSSPAPRTRSAATTRRAATCSGKPRA